MLQRSQEFAAKVGASPIPGAKDIFLMKWVERSITF